MDQSGVVFELFEIFEIFGPDVALCDPLQNGIFGEMANMVKIPPNIVNNGHSQDFAKNPILQGVTKSDIATKNLENLKRLENHS